MNYLKESYCGAKKAGAILLAPFDTLHGSYPFDRIQEEDYLPAFEQAIRFKRAEIDRIITNPEPPTFANTLLALENCGEDMERVAGVFFNLLHSDSNDNLMAISEEILPKLTELSTYISLNELLFRRIEAIYKQRESLGLTDEENRLLTRCYEGFVDSGALLPEEKKQELRDIAQELSKLTLQVGQNALRDEKRFTLLITNPEDVAGMPQTVLDAAHHKAKEKGNEGGWLFDLTAPSYSPFMQHCPNSELRRQMYIARMTVGATDNEYDNRPHIISIANLRRRTAQIMGYPSFAQMVLKDRMAETPANVYALLDRLLTAYKPTAREEVAKIEELAAESGIEKGSLHIWDWAYWAERYKQKYYELDDEMLRPYFPLNRVIEGVFGLAERLYGISFCPSSVSVYHPDVKAYEVKNFDGSYLGLFYTDFFPRAGKQSGAWMNNFQEQYRTAEGEDHRPHIVLVMNFTPPAPDKPSLLTIGEVNTFLHEFGHALHGLFSRCRFGSLSGTSVVRDFVELPSQLMENWAIQPEWLNSFAAHYQTGEPIPIELLDKLRASRHFLTAYACCRQLSFGYLDMAWHTIEQDLPSDLDIKTYEEDAWSKALVLPPSPPETMMSPSFGHIFSGGYAAGYYGYKWSEVLDADAFAAFKEEGLFSREVAERFRHCILEQGDMRDAMELYETFRGRKPSIEAMMERDGIAVGAKVE